MENFEFLNKTKIVFGKGTEDRTGEIVKRYAKRKVLLHYGQGSIKRSGLYDTVRKSLDTAGIGYVELGGVQPNPRLKLVYQGIEICKNEGVDLILAVGGGSVIDSAKAIAVGVPYDGDVWDFYTEKGLPSETLPVGVVLTIPAAGSESSKSSVITREEGWLKRPLNIELIHPVFAIMNPDPTSPLPPYQTACGAADIMAHVMERYFTRVTDVDFTDRLCEATLRTVIANTPIVLEKPEDYAARSQIMWAGSIAHNDLLSTGRIGDFGSHKIEHELSGIYDVAHGAGLTTVFPAWMKYVYTSAIPRFAQFAVRVWGVENDFSNPERTALAGIERLKNFFASIGLPVSLKELEIPTDRIEEMAEKAVAYGKIGAFQELDKDDIVAILKMAQ